LSNVEAAGKHGTVGSRTGFEILTSMPMAICMFLSVGNCRASGLAFYNLLKSFTLNLAICRMQCKGYFSAMPQSEEVIFLRIYKLYSSVFRCFLWGNLSTSCSAYSYCSDQSNLRKLRPILGPHRLVLAPQPPCLSKNSRGNKPSTARRTGRCSPRKKQA
jgi:hypothetical protein